MLIAGGVSMVLFMNVGLLRPERLVSLARIDALRGVERSGGELLVGAMETHARLADEPLISRSYPALADLFGGIANVRIREWGTIGGNLAHADPAQDPAVFLTALGAAVDVIGPRGARLVPVEELTDGPLSPTIDGDEIITTVRIPLAPSGRRSAYVKFLPGTQDDYATVSIAAVLDHDERGAVTAARIAAGSVGPTALHLPSASDLLVGHAPDPDMLNAVHAAVRDEVEPRSDRRGSADYKREMAGVMARRAVAACATASGVAP